MSLSNADSIARTPCESRRELLRSYCQLNEAFDEHVWDEADRILPTKSGYRTAAQDRREMRLACVMGDPL